MALNLDAFGAALLAVGLVVAFGFRKFMSWAEQPGDVRDVDVRAEEILADSDLDAELIQLLIEEQYYYGEHDDDLMLLADEVFEDGGEGGSR